MTEKSTGDTVRNLSDQLGTLVRDEIRAALDEMRAKARQAGVGGVLVVLACVLALYAGGAFVTALVAALDRVLPRWLAAAVSGVVLSGVAAVAGMAGVDRLRKASPPVPERTLAEAESDAEAVARTSGAHSPGTTRS